MSAEDFDPVMLEMLQTELVAQLVPMEAALAALSSNPAAPVLNDLVRGAHSIRGAARIVNADALADAAAKLEKRLETIVSRKEPIPTSLLTLIGAAIDDLNQFSTTPPDESAHWLAAREDEFKSYALQFEQSGTAGLTSQMQATLVSAAPVSQESPAPAVTEVVEPIDASMFEMFQTEVVQHASDLSSGLLELENNPRELERVNALMRAAHSMKGAARIVGIEQGVRISHVMEDFFIAVQQGKQTVGAAAVDVMLRAVDMLGKLAAQNADQCSTWLAQNGKIFEQLADEIETLDNNAVDTPAAPSASIEPAPEEILDPSMLEMFRMEVEGYATQLNDGLLQVENAVASNETLQALMRAAHSIKGASRIVGIEVGVELAHAMEDCLVAAQKGQLPQDRVPADDLLRAVDYFSQFSAASADATEAGRWLATNRAAMSALAEALTRSTQNGGGNSADSAPPASTPGPSSTTSLQSSPGSLPASAASQASGSSAHGSSGPRAVRVTAESLNKILGLAGELLVETRWHARFLSSLTQIKHTQTRLQTRLRLLRQKLEDGADAEQLAAALTDIDQSAVEASRSFGERLTEFDRFAYRADTLSQRLYKEAVSSRMRPFDDGVQGFPRLVRDVARRLGKRVNLIIEGRAVEVDRDILEKLEAPLNHLIRNAVDHGCETPDRRKQNGKGETATLKLEARHRAGMLHVSVSDDGGGVDLDRVKARILDRKLAAPEMVARMSTAEILEFLFLPGFSTKEQVTEISGRGVGLDVVQSMVQEAGGTVRVQSKFGEGTSFLLQLPITRSVLRALMVRINGDPYAFPLSRVDRLQSVDREAVRTLEGRQFIKDDEGALGVVRASQVLGLKGQSTSGTELHIVICSERNTRYGWVVDGFSGECELVLRTLDPRLGKVPAVSAAAILDDGTPVVILDVEDMIRATESVLKGDTLDVIGAANSGPRRAEKKRVLVVDDSFTVRETERKLLERAGFDVKVAVDGMEGWNAVRSAPFDLVVSDVDIPRLNGFEFVKRIKKDPKLQKIPVIIVSYKDRDEDRAKGAEAGANLYLTKGSFQDRTFIEAVNELLGARTP